MNISKQKQSKKTLFHFFWKQQFLRVVGVGGLAPLSSFPDAKQTNEQQQYMKITNRALLSQAMQPSQWGSIPNFMTCKSRSSKRCRALALSRLCIAVRLRCWRIYLPKTWTQWYSNELVGYTVCHSGRTRVRGWVQSQDGIRLCDLFWEWDGAE